jgi:hypothetical protein
VPFAQRAAVPKQQDKAALAEANVKELLLLMDTDKTGKISKQEWMKFMEAEFRQAGHGQERGTGSKPAIAIEGLGHAEAFSKRWQVTSPLDTITEGCVCR